MTEPTITAEDLTLYALELLDGAEKARVEAVLGKSTAAREELASIRGDLSVFAMAAEQHTPPALTRQRLLKQVARERRTVPLDLAIPDERPQAAAPNVFAPDPSGTRAAAEPELQASDPVAPSYRGQAMRAPQTRAFPSRLQMREASVAKPAVPVPRLIQEPRAIAPEPDLVTFTATPETFAGPGSFAVDRSTFAPDPPLFPREERAPATSASAHSITIFEQQFAAEPAPPDAAIETVMPELLAARRDENPADDSDFAQDRYVPTAAAETSFGFSSYRDGAAEEDRGGGMGRFFAWSGWALAASVAVAALFALRDDFNLREQLSTQVASLTAAQSSAARAETVLQALQSPSSQHFLLARTDAAPAPTGRVTYLPERGTVVFQGSNLEALQPYRTYELWLIPAGEGRQPMPAGLFKPDGHGYATVVLPHLEKGVVASNFGVTIEDDGGSATPTLPILLVGQQALGS